MRKLKVLLLESEGFYSNLLNREFTLSCDVTYLPFFKSVTHSYISNFDFVGYTLYSSPYYHSVIRIADEAGIATGLFVDGISEFSNFSKNNIIKKSGIENYHPIISCSIFSVGERSKLYFGSFGRLSFNYCPIRVLDKGKLMLTNHDDANEPLFLITTANTAYYDKQEFDDLIVLLNYVTSGLSSMGIRYCYRIFDEKILSELPDADNIIECSFSECLKTITSVITTPSSISIESMSMGKPTATLLYRDSPLFHQSGWLVFLGVSISDVVSSMLEREEKRMAFQNSELISSIEGEDLVRDVTEVVRLSRAMKKDEFNKKMNENCLNSKFNFNFEHEARYIYLKFKKIKFISKYFKKIRDGK